MGTNSFYASALTLKNPGYDPAADFTPLAALGIAPYVLMSPSSVPSRTLKELVAYAKANPGKTNYGPLEEAPHRKSSPKTLRKQPVSIGRKSPTRVERKASPRP
jgi:hypothetical protein